MKFEIRLTINDKNKKFAEKCRAAISIGEPVTYKRKKHYVYHFEQGSKKYHIGLVGVDSG